MSTYQIKLDSRRATKRDQYPVILYLYSNGEKKLIPLKLKLSQVEWDNCHPEKNENYVLEQFKVRYRKLQELADKARHIAEQLGSDFNVKNFIQKWEVKEKSAVSTLAEGFQDYINKLRGNDQIGYAIIFETTLSKIKEFNAENDTDIRLKDVTAEWLTSFEKWMKKGNTDKKRKGCNNTTISYYMRNIKRIINIAIKQTKILKRENNPFHTEENQDGYKIPHGTSGKEPLEDEDLKMISQYKTSPESAEDFSKDWWMFIYRANGMNNKDICRLTWSNVKKDEFTFIRAKTENTTKGKPIPITVVITDKIKEHFKKYATDKKKDHYVFPFLHEGVSPEQEHKLIQDFVKKVNYGAKQMAEDLGIEKKITNYVARHTFATKSTKEGTSLVSTSRMLGHKDIKTTMHYVGLDTKQEREAASNRLENF